MAIRKRIMTAPAAKPAPERKGSYIRWPDDWTDAELANYFDQKVRVAKINKSVYFQKKVPESQLPSYRGVMTEVKAMEEVVKRLRKKKSSDIVQEGSTAEDVLDEQKRTGATGQDFDNVSEGDGAPVDNSTV